MTFNLSARTIAIAAVCGVAGLWSVGRLWAFNPQPDPPAMAAMWFLNSETATLFAHCSDESIFGVNPGPCVVSLKFEDQSGSALKETTLTLRPGQTGLLQMQGAEVPRSSAGPILFTPCIRSSLGGRTIPSVQVTDSATGKTSFFAGPAAPRLTFFGI